MKAIIMAGGEGSRLRPLTCDIPKPMARLCGRPILEYILELLERHGCAEAALTLRYLPDRITERFPEGRYRGIALEFVEEHEPLGTAGSVRNACGADDSDVLVISGDALCDFDLTAARSRHLESGADVTILGKRVDDPREYGLIVADNKGNITGFVEKPAFSQAVSDLANTGIYILSRSALDMIPAGKSYDFARDLFPRMLESGMKLMCYEAEGYWCDIGDLDTYMSCQRDMLEGKVECDIRASGSGGVLVAEGGVLPDGDYALVPPVYIGRDVSIADGALIEAGAVLDDGCSVGPGARVTGGVLLQNSSVGRRARLTGALLGAGAAVKESAMLFEGAAVGAGAVIGEKAAVNAGVKVWNGKTIPPSANLTEHFKTGGMGRDIFDDDGISGEVGVELTPEFCARLGAAVGTLYPGGRIGVGCGSHRGAAVLAAAVAAGIQSAGAGVMDFGETFGARFEFSVGFAGLKCGVFVCGDSRSPLRVVGEGGLPADRAMERGIEGLLARGEFARKGWDDMGDNVAMTGMDMMYASQLIRCAPGGLTGFAARVRSRNLAVRGLMRGTLNRLGCDDAGELLLELSAQGHKVRAYDGDGGYIPHHKILAVCAAYRMERGDDVAVPFDAPRALDDIAAGTGRRLLRYAACPADEGDAEARRLAKFQMWSRDGLMQAVMFLHIARRSGSVDRALSALPDYERAARTVSTTGNPAGLMRRLNGESPHAGGGRVTEGVLLRRGSGVILVRPLKRGAGVRILAEARSSETAAELCDFAERLLSGR